MHCELRWVCVLLYVFVDNVFVYKKSPSLYLPVCAHLWRGRTGEASPLPKSLCGMQVGCTQAGLCPGSSQKQGPRAERTHHPESHGEGGAERGGPL